MGAGLMALQVGLQMAAQHKQAKAQRVAAENAADAARKNAKIEDVKRQQISEQYRQKEKQHIENIKQTRGQIRAAAGSAGLSTDGSANDVLNSSGEKFKQAMQNENINQKNATWSSYVNEVDWRNKANEYSAAAKNIKSAENLGYFTTIVGAAAQAYSSGMFGGKNNTTTNSDWTYDASGAGKNPWGINVSRTSNSIGSTNDWTYSGIKTKKGYQSFTF